MNTDRNQFNERLGARLKHARELAGLSQQEAAKLINLHRPTMSEIEAGKRPVTAKELRALAKIYGTSTSWLLSEEEARDPALDRVVRLFLELRKEDLRFILRILRLLKMEKNAGANLPSE